MDCLLLEMDLPGGASQTHLPFKLSQSDGGSLRLFNADIPSATHTMTFAGGYLSTDESFGLSPDGRGGANFGDSEESPVPMRLAEPTPGAPNSGSYLESCKGQEGLVVNELLASNRNVGVGRRLGMCYYALVFMEGSVVTFTAGCVSQY